MEKKFTPASPATAFASKVLPTPGGPHRSMPPEVKPIPAGRLCRRMGSVNSFKKQLSNNKRALKACYSNDIIFSLYILFFLFVSTDLS